MISKIQNKELKLKKYKEEFTMDLKELGCRCACHETDHLDGLLFTRLVDEFVQMEDA